MHLPQVIDVVDLERKISIVGELKNSVLRCISDQNGNHVIQKCIECVPEDHIPFVIEDILKKIYPLCTHQYGCRVIQVQIATFCFLSIKFCNFKW
jgi:pumilio RNA-binding family